MRTIEISTAVFARIWAQRSAGEEDENAILERVLGLKASELQAAQPSHTVRTSARKIKLIVWRDDVQKALHDLGGKAHLKEIYRKVREIRTQKERSIPVNLDAIVRRELEFNSSDAAAFQGKHDLFYSPEGIGSGVWALREGGGK